MIERILSIAMLPVGFLIVMEELGLLSILSFDKVMIGAALMIVAQLASLIALNTHHQGLRIINYVSFLILIVPSVLYFASSFTSFSFQDSLPLIIGVMMFVEGMYALH